MYQHVLGTRVSQDKLLFGNEFRGELLGPLDLVLSSLSDDYRYLVVEIDRGVPAKRVDIVYRDLTKPNSYFDVLIWGVESRFSADYVKGAWYVKTDYQSPNGRILKADPGIMPEAWTTVVPEGPEAIDAFNIVGSRIYVKRLKDVKTEISAYTLDGKPAGGIEFEGVGAASVPMGRSTDRYGFLSFESYIMPPAIYRVDTTTGKRDVFAQPKVPFDSSEYELKQVFLTSKDGTRDPHVHCRQKGAEAGWDGAAADDGLRRLRFGRAAGMESGVGMVVSSRADGLPCPTCAAAMNMASIGTSRGCSLVSRMSSTIGLPRPST